MLNSKWDLRLLILAFHWAKWSKDPSTRIGAVIADQDRRVLSLGYNGFPPGIADSHDRLHDRPTKYALIQHAERNAIDMAEMKLAGATLYSTQFPCSECMKSIITRRVARIVAPEPDEQALRDKWSDDMITSKDMAIEAGRQITFYSLNDIDAAWRHTPELPTGAIDTDPLMMLSQRSQELPDTEETWEPPDPEEVLDPQD